MKSTTIATTLREAAGWAMFRLARHTMRLSGRLLGREVPLGHVADMLAERLDRAPYSAAQRTA